MATLSQSTGTKVSTKELGDKLQVKRDLDIRAKLRQTTVAIASSQIGLSYGVSRMSTREWIRHYLEMVSVMSKRRGIIRQLDPNVLAAETEALKKRHEELQAERRRYEASKATMSVVNRVSTSTNKVRRNAVPENSQKTSKTGQLATVSLANAPKSKSLKGLKP